MSRDTKDATLQKTVTEKDVQKFGKTEEEKRREDDFKVAMEFFGLPPEQISKVLGVIQDVLDTIRGVKDIKGKLAPLLEPSGRSIETTAQLSPSQANAVADMFICKELFSFFEPIGSVANHRCLTSASVGGRGRDDVIALAGAFSGEKLLSNLMIGASVPNPTELQRKQAEKKGLFK